MQVRVIIAPKSGADSSHLTIFVLCFRQTVGPKSRLGFKFKVTTQDQELRWRFRPSKGALIFGIYRQKLSAGAQSDFTNGDDSAVNNCSTNSSSGGGDNNKPSAASADPTSGPSASTASAKTEAENGDKNQARLPSQPSPRGNHDDLQHMMFSSAENFYRDKSESPLSLSYVDTSAFNHATYSVFNRIRVYCIECPFNVLHLPCFCLPSFVLCFTRFHYI